MNDEGQREANQKTKKALAHKSRHGTDLQHEPLGSRGN